MRVSLVSFVWLAAFAASASAQTRQDIPVGQVPENVRQVLAKYMQVLQIEDEEESASQASAIMGGSLMGRDNTKMSNSTRQYGFKKDRQNVRFYSVPPVITRCQRFENETEGFQTTAVTGTRYKIWVAKKPGQPGLPAPVSIMVTADGRVFVCGTVGSL